MTKKKTATAKSKTTPSKVGRPSLYNTQYNEQVIKLCKLGITDKEMADFFNISESTLNLWKIEHPEFSESIKRGKMLADANVAERLYERATGYSHPDIDIKVVEGRIVKTELIKHYPPDSTALIFWLKNRNKKHWRDKQELGITDGEGNDVISVGYGKESDG